MQKAILDTNIIVSALIQKSYPYFILYDLYLERKFELCVSEALIVEYYDVLGRQKFLRFPNFAVNATWLLKDIHDYATLFYPTVEIDVIKDHDDNKLLELAVESNADFLVTGNTNDFIIPAYHNTKILSPKDFWEYYK